MMKKYKNIQSMLESLVEDKKERAEKIKKIEKRHLSKVLKAFRLKKRVTQICLAKKMGCDQSSVSKLERSNDNDITIGDLKKYLFSLGMGLGISLREKVEKINRVDLIKHHVKKIETYVSELEEIAEDDDGIKIGVYEAYLSQIKGLLDDFGKKFNNFKTTLEKKYNKKISKDQKEKIHISLPYDAINKKEEALISK